MKADGTAEMWVVKYWLTRGVVKVEGKLWGKGHEQYNSDSYTHEYFRMPSGASVVVGKEAFATEAAAWAAVVQMAKRKELAVRKQLAKVWKMREKAEREWERTVEEGK